MVYWMGGKRSQGQRDRDLRVRGDGEGQLITSVSSSGFSAVSFPFSMIGAFSACSASCIEKTVRFNGQIMDHKTWGQGYPQLVYPSISLTISVSLTQLALHSTMIYGARWALSNLSRSVEHERPEAQHCALRLNQQHGGYPNKPSAQSGVSVKHCFVRSCISESLQPEGFRR